MLKKLWKLEAEAKGGVEDLQKAVSEVKSLVENVMASISAQGQAQGEKATQASK